MKLLENRQEKCIFCLDPNPRGLEYCPIFGNATNKSLGSTLFRRSDDFWQLRFIQFASRYPGGGILKSGKFFILSCR